MYVGLTPTPAYGKKGVFYKYMFFLMRMGGEQTHTHPLSECGGLYTMLGDRTVVRLSNAGDVDTAPYRP